MTNNKQQTVVEWLLNEIWEHIEWKPQLEKRAIVMKFEQAKEMEKQQAQHWFKFGMLLVEGHLWKPLDKFEQYYNENHEQNNQSNQEHI